ESEEEEEGAPVKRSRPQEGAEEEALLRPVKLSRGELYKPPTTEELNRLRETESLFHCSLLKMQMEELLKEVVLSERRRRLIDSFVKEVTALLETVPRTSDTELCDQSWLPGGVKVPFLQVPQAVKGRFRMAPPASVSLVGSYPLRTCTKPHATVDLAVTMPPEILQQKDNLNQRYPRKRALYLAGLAHHLTSRPAIGSLRFSCLHGNRLRPLLLLTPPGKDDGRVTLRVHALPPPGFFKPSRLHPQKNNVRTHWYTEQSSELAAVSDPGERVVVFAVRQLLSVYDGRCIEHNNKILKHCESNNKIVFPECCYDCGINYSAIGKVNWASRTSPNQKLRNERASTDLTENGISLAKGSDPTAPSLPEFHSVFQVVFVDPSGHLNLCADMTASTYRQVQQEAALSLQFWDDPTLDSFQALLMTPKPLLRSYDHVFQLCELVKLQSACKKLDLLAELMDHSGNYVITALPFILSLLQRGLGERIRLLTHSLPPAPEFAVDCDPPKHKDQPALSFGLLLNPELNAAVLERGPAADSPQAVEFRQLWGDRAELRRFQDGAICEAVLWGGTSAYEKRLVPRDIVAYLLQLVLDSPVHIIPLSVLSTLSVLFELEDSTWSVCTVHIVSALCLFTLRLQQGLLEHVPFCISSLSSALPLHHDQPVFPALPVKVDYSFFERQKKTNALIPLAGKPCPVHIMPIKVVCHMEGSGKWPQEALAIRHIKAAFHVQLAALLRAQHQLPCQPSPTHLDVYKDGLVFRVQVAYHREPQVLRETVSPEGMLRYRDNAEAQRLELETLHRPYLTGMLHGLQQQHLAFGAACRLAKRWLGAQLFLGELSEDAADLLVASVFLRPAPHTPPGSPQVGFLRFLYMLSTFDWKNSPLVVNLNGELTDADFTQIKNDFIASRSSLPVMFIATPKDKNLSVWTKEGPSVQVLQHLILVAAESLRVLETQLMDPTQPQDVKVAFRPPLEVYDVLIHLIPRQVPGHGQAIDTPHPIYSRGTLPASAPTGPALPVVDFNPVDRYLAELRDAFGELALFLCDPYGGTVIAVLWKPQAFAPQPFKTSLTSARRVEVVGGEAHTVPNVEAILEDFRVMGAGLVKDVEARTEKWVI
uniref:Nucleolar protein 6 n=1 Tax=Lepisosteus oculatus TaxID=7918 RepID=W5MCA8_LEPOC